MLRELRVQSLARDVDRFTAATAICGEHAGVREGLYVFLFANRADVPVFDDNPTRKIVVHRDGLSIKPGKFEQGFAVRVADYIKHLHRERLNNVPVPVFGESFVFGYWLDLSSLAQSVPAPARVFERYWTEAVGTFLIAHGLLAGPEIKQKARAEWRYLRPENWTPRVAGALRRFLGEVAERIFDMARVGAMPSPPMA